MPVLCVPSFPLRVASCVLNICAPHFVCVFATAPSLQRPPPLCLAQPPPLSSVNNESKATLPTTIFLREPAASGTHTHTYTRSTRPHNTQPHTHTHTPSSDIYALSPPSPSPPFLFFAPRWPPAQMAAAAPATTHPTISSSFFQPSPFHHHHHNNNTRGARELSNTRTACALSP